MSDLSESSIPYVAPQILVVIVFMRLTVWNWLTSYQYNKDQLIGPFSSWPMTFLLKQCNSVFPIYISPWSHVPTKDDLSTRPCRRGNGIASAAPRLQPRFCATHVESRPRAGQVFRSWVCFFSLSVVSKALEDKHRHKSNLYDLAEKLLAPWLTGPLPSARGSTWPTGCSAGKIKDCLSKISLQYMISLFSGVKWWLTFSTQAKLQCPRLTWVQSFNRCKFLLWRFLSFFENFS